MAEVNNDDNNSQDGNYSARNFYNHAATHIHGFGKDIVQEVEAECWQAFDVKEAKGVVQNYWRGFFHIPYLPSLHQPGWMLRYITGPHTPALLENFFSDFWAGITVALTLIPQGLSYAQLANLPPICGLYTATIPAAVYTFFGSSMQLTVGPVALISLMMGTLTLQYNIDTSNVNEAIDFAGECALAVGTILLIMSVVNLGNFIRFISHPVMSGFTTAAAMLIGLNQLKSAFNFVKLAVPQQGQEGFEYNYMVLKWFLDHWNDPAPGTVKASNPSGTVARDHYGTQICFGLYIPLMIILLINNNLPATPARNKSWAFKAWKMFASLSPFIAIIIGAHVAYEIKKKDHFNEKAPYVHEYYAKNLKIVGQITPGLDILRHSSMRWDFGKLMGDVFPLTLIAFMESYSVAHRIATQKNELHLLNASQEMWAVGCANMMASICSGYPVAGSFSRSSLNAAAGAKTPLSKATTMSVILIALRWLTKTFEFIPNAALAAVIFVAVFNLISFSDFWHAWKHSKKDFFTMLVTATFVFVFDTSLGLAVGLGCSFLVFCGEHAFSPATAPELIAEKESNNGIDVIKLNADLTFLTAFRFKDFFLGRVLRKQVEPDEAAACGDKAFHRVHTFLDTYLSPSLISGVEVLPKAVVLDFDHVRIIDISGMEQVAEAARDCRRVGVKFVAYNINLSNISDSFAKYGIHNDRSTDDVNLEAYLSRSTLPLLDVKAVEDVKPLDVSVSDDGEPVNKKQQNGEYELVNIPKVEEV